ncbi:MAG: hypothetical protein H7837_10290 [Magnetococcus sp. MYC-9]
MMSAEEHDNPVSPDSAVVLTPLQLETLAAPATDWVEPLAVTPLATITDLSIPEPVVLNAGTEQAPSPVDPPPSPQTVQVPIEPLGEGLLNLLAGTVEQVVKTARGLSSPARKRDTPPRSAPADSPAAGLRQGVTESVRAVTAEVGVLVHNGANILAGLADCLRTSLDCMGRVIRHPGQRPCRKPQQQNSAPRRA